MLETVGVGTQDLYEHSGEAEAVTQLHGLAAPLENAYRPPQRHTLQRRGRRDPLVRDTPLRRCAPPT